jgi:large subunit ribosomal protein L31
MKKDLHSAFHIDTQVVCSCGNKFLTGSTVEGEIRVESCSKCHPFYTGENKIRKTSSVDKFYARQKKTGKVKKDAE